jgi:hypothetical protein
MLASNSPVIGKVSLSSSIVPAGSGTSRNK